MAPNPVIVITGLMVLSILFLTLMFARLFQKAGPNKALIIYGFRGTRLIKGQGTVVFPMIENYRRFSLELMSFDVAPTGDLHTRDGAALAIEAVTQVRVKSDPESILTAAEQFLAKTSDERETAIRLIMENHLRRIVSQLTAEEIVKQPELVADRMRSTYAGDMSNIGLEVVSFSINGVRAKAQRSS
jgi:flotillin